MNHGIELKIRVKSRYDTKARSSSISRHQDVQVQEREVKMKEKQKTGARSKGFTSKQRFSLF